MSRRTYPRLRTPRLVLRAFTRADSDTVTRLAGEREIAVNTLNIPHPYEQRHAIEWIDSHAGQLHRHEAATFAVTRSSDGILLGAAGLILDAEHRSGELGYWIGRPYWGQGFATEAARAVVEWGFDELDLHRVHASHFPRNPASGNVLRKLGMRSEGRLREHVLKWGEFLDIEMYGVLREEFARTNSGSPGIVVERPDER